MKIKTHESLSVHIGQTSLDCKVYLDGKEIEGITEISVPPIVQDSQTVVSVKLSMLASKLTLDPGVYEVVVDGSTSSGEEP